MNLKYQIYLPGILSVIFVIGMLFGYGLRNIPVAPNVGWKNANKDKNTLIEAIGLINQNYFERKETSNMVHKALYEMVDELDPYSMYIPPYHSEMLAVSNKGIYRGIGIETMDINDKIFISKLINDGPAYKLNILKGSNLVAIDAIQTKESNWNTDSLSIYLNDHKEKELQLVLDHFQYLKPKRFTITPSEVRLLNISESYRLKEDVGYVRIARFGLESYKDFMTAMEVLLVNDSLSNLIIDVRGNPGGYVQEVCKIISQLLPDRIEFLRTVEANGDSQPFSSLGQAFFHIGNIIVLIDENSASASEILAGVLQDMDRAIIIGEDSFGKGLVQEQFNLSNGGVIRLSVSRYQLPSGRFLGQQDSLQFETLYKKRKLTSKGKIVPDFEIQHHYAVGNKSMFRAAVQSLNVNNLTSSVEEYLRSIVAEKDSNSNLRYEKASIIYNNHKVRKSRILNDPLTKKSFQLISEKDKWGILN